MEDPQILQDQLDTLQSFIYGLNDTDGKPQTRKNAMVDPVPNTWVAERAAAREETATRLLTLTSYLKGLSPYGREAADMIIRAWYRDVINHA